MINRVIPGKNHVYISSVGPGGVLSPILFQMYKLYILYSLLDTC